MKTKDKKGGKKNRKSLARYGIEWHKDKKGYNKAHAYLKPDAITTPLTESAKAMKDVFVNTYEEHPEPVLSKKQRKKAKVVAIGSKPKLHSVTNPSRASPEELESQIAALESHIEVTTSDKECEFVGPPKPALSLVQSSPQVEDVGKSTPEQPVLSHDSANDAELHSVTTHDNGDYTYEELAQLCDMYQLDIMELKATYQQRIDLLNDHINEMGRSLLEERRAKNVAEFLESHTSAESEDKMRKRISYLNGQLKEADDEMFKLKAQLRIAKQQLEDAHKFNSVVAEQNERLRSGPNYEVALAETEHDLQYFRQENSDLRKEIDLLMYTIDQYNKNYQASNKSKPPLKKLASEFNIYNTLHRDDPVRNFLRYSGYCIGQTEALKKYFDDEADLRVLLSNERGVHRRWSNIDHKARNAVTSERRAMYRMSLRHSQRRLHGVTNVDKLEQRWVVHQERQVYRGWGARRTTPRVTTRLLRHEVRLWWSTVPWEEINKIYDKAEFNRKKALLNDVKGSKLYKPAKAVVTFFKKVDDILETELSPSKRKEIAEQHAKFVAYEERAASHRKANRKAARAKAKAAKVEASNIKRMMEADDERADMRDRILKRGAYFNT